MTCRTCAYYDPRELPHPGFGAHVGYCVQLRGWVRIDFERPMRGDMCRPEARK